MKRQLPIGSSVDQLAQLVAVTGARAEERQDEQLRRSALQLAIECARVYTCHEQIVCRQGFGVNCAGGGSGLVAAAAYITAADARCRLPTPS